MNVSGVNNLGFFPQAKAAKGNASEKGEASSFEDVLAQTDRTDKKQADQSETETAASATTLPAARRAKRQP